MGNEKEADEENKSENEDRNIFFISTRPSKETEKMKEDTPSDKDSTDDDNDENEPIGQQENVPKSEAKKRKKKQSSDKAGRKYPKYNQETEMSLEKFLFGK